MTESTSSRRSVAPIFVWIALALSIYNFVAPAPEPEAKVVIMTHAALDASSAQSLDLGAPGPSVGDQLLVYVPLTGALPGSLVGSLTTVGIDQPSAGQQVRTSNLTFVLNNGDDQIVVGGSAVYEVASPTLAIGQVTKRPIVGGSGAYANARGWLETIHREDDSWTQTAYLYLD